MQKAIEDPAIVADGYTYERAAIESWLEQHSISPVTGQPLDHTHIIANHVFKSLGAIV